MNWRRSLLWLWLALSLGWIAGIGVVVWREGPPHDEAWHKDMDACLEAKKTEGAAEPWFDCYIANTPLVPARMTLTDIPAVIREYGLVALLPPLAVLGGLLGAWVIARKRAEVQG
jgi:hypothetical protein